MPLSFIKMHGLGNDFIVIDGRAGGSKALSEQKKALSREGSRRLCDRRFGIGADQILWIRPARSKGVAAAMEVINADGSRAEMCGNGIRAVVLYLDESLPQKNRKPRYLIETGAGTLEVEILPAEGAQRLARVAMGIPKIGQPSKLKLRSGREVSYLPVSMGNPHAVVFVENCWEYPVELEGPEIERHPKFPKRTNVEFCHPESKTILTTRVWERGAGLTLACGTGACAAAVGAIASGLCQSPVEVKLPGGSLKIEWEGKGQPVMMSGPAVEAFRGEWRS